MSVPIDNALEAPKAAAGSRSGAPERLVRAMELARKLSVARSPEAFAELLEHAALELANAERARCLYFDAASHALWKNAGDEIEEHNASFGVAGAAARHGTMITVPRTNRDPRWKKAVDDPHGDGTEHLLALPIVDPDHHIHAVVVIVKSVRAGNFNSADLAVLALLAREAGAISRRLATEVELAETLEHQHREEGMIFRAEAVEAHLQKRVRGDVVRVTPAWIEWTYLLLIALLILSAAYLVFGSVNRYSSGAAVVQLNGRTDVTANVSGTVVSVEVQPKDQVEAGQVLVRLYDDEESAERERIRAEFEAQLRNWMRDPRDQAANQAVRELRGQLESAEARLSRRTIVAPHAGVIADLRVRIGQHLDPGDSAISIARKQQAPSLIALLPGSDRPLLAAGMRARFELSGYRYAYQRLIVESVSEEVFSPKEAMRVLGQKTADGLTVPGPVVLVRFQLPSDSFEADGERYRYHDGMRGTVEVRVRAESILATLIPALKELESHGDEGDR